MWFEPKRAKRLPRTELSCVSLLNPPKFTSHGCITAAPARPCRAVQTALVGPCGSFARHERNRSCFRKVELLVYGNSNFRLIANEPQPALRGDRAQAVFAPRLSRVGNQVHIGTTVRASCRTAAKIPVTDPHETLLVPFEQHSERACHAPNCRGMLSAQRMPPTSGIA